MAYEIEFDPEAVKDLKKLDRPDQQRQRPDFPFPPPPLHQMSLPWIHGRLSGELPRTGESLRQTDVRVKSSRSRHPDDLHIVGQEHHHGDLSDQIGGAHHRAVHLDLFAKAPAVFGLRGFQHQHHVDVQ